jgi:hypothetical protein
MAAKQVKSKVRPHRFYADGEVPPDHKGARRCRRCGLMGKPGDPHHPTDADDEEFPASPEGDFRDRMIGEGGQAT